MPSRKIIILHEWDGRPYFQALEAVVRAETGAPPEYRELWFIRQMAIGLVRRNPSLIARSVRNLLFFLRSFFLKDAVIILGFAPFDPSMIFWGRLRRKNRVIYHTSWVKWDGSDVPKRSLAFPGFVRSRWKTFLEDPRISVVSVLPESKPAMLEHYRKDPALFTAIPHAVDLAVFQAAAKPAADGKGVARSPSFTSESAGGGAPLKVIYLGRLNARKGIDVVAEMIENAPADRFRFGVLGNGPEWSRLEPLKNRFAYHGFHEDKAEVARILSGYDVLILPSFFEPFGIVLIEAMACGVVCAVSDGLFPKDLIHHGMDGFILPRTAPAFMALLEKLHGDRDLLQSVRAAGFERVKEFEIKAIGDRWKAVLYEA